MMLDSAKPGADGANGVLGTGVGTGDREGQGRTELRQAQALMCMELVSDFVLE